MRFGSISGFPEPSQGRRNAGDARDLRDLRDSAPVGEEVRQGIRRSDPPARACSRRQMAYGRGRHLDRRRATLALARRRSERHRSRRPGPMSKRHAAQRLMKRLLKSAIMPPRVMITDKLRSYGAARAKMDLQVEHRQHKGLNNRAENSHQPTRRRERIMKRFK